MSLDQKTIQELRTEAKKIAQSQSGIQQSSSNNELLHELTVRNIELELQNQQLQESLDTYKKLYQNASVGCISLDSQGIIRQANETFARFCNISPSDLHNQPLGDFLTEESTSSFMKQLNGFSKNPEGKILPLWLQGMRQKPVFLRMTGEKKTYADLVACTLVDATAEKRTEQELLTLKERFIQLFEHMRAGVAVYRAVEDGTDFVFIDFNKAAEKIENIDRYSVLGRKITEVFPEVKAFGLLDVLQKVCKTGVPEEHPITEYADERIRGWRDNYVYKLPTGEIVTIFTDVTEEKKTEMALAESEERFQLAAEGTRDGLWDLNLETYEAYMSERYSTMLGYTPDELPRSGAAWSDLLHPDDKDTAEQRLKAYLAKEIENYDSTFRMRAKDGSYRWINGRGQAIWDDSGKPIRIIGFNTDITSLVETRNELAKANEIINRSPVSAFVWQNRPGWPVSFVSENVETLLGFTAQEFISQTIAYRELIHPEDLPRVEQEVSSQSIDPDALHIDHEPYRLTTKNNETIWVADRTYIYRDAEGDIVHFEGIVYDITEQIEAREEIKVLRGILPICSFCKEIRDDQGAWKRLEEYIMEHSSAEFSHSICEKCLAEKYPRQHEKLNNNSTDNTGN